MRTLALAIAVAVGISSALGAADSATMTQIKQDGKIRLGMYLGFEGLSFIQKGRQVGLEVELAKLVCDELSKDLGTAIAPEIVNQEWAQIIQELNGGKYHAVFSALIPSGLYGSANILYTASYLDTGPVICTQEKDGKPAKDVTAEVQSLKDKVVVVINDPAVRQVLRKCGVYVPADEGKTTMETAFPVAETKATMARAGKTGELIPVKEIRQLDEMPAIYKLIAEGEVDAGVIDLGIIWWVSTDSERWSKRIVAFPTPVGPYIYSAVTRAADQDVRDALDRAIAKVRQSPGYASALKQWHGGFDQDWKLGFADFLK
jgi:ABC-type amino acid transport substrate-binding protein